MITQFGYITIWSLVWPLAPIFALINNYVELRADAVKICKHVRRPVGDRVESIGSWLETLVRPLPPCPHLIAPPSLGNQASFPLLLLLRHIIEE